MIERIVIGLIVAAAALWTGRILRRNWRRGRCGGCKGHNHCATGHRSGDQDSHNKPFSGVIGRSP
ncbi:MAG: FeoB-associated Cys-rich membrane protein [Planctomycetota bacterium]